MSEIRIEQLQLAADDGHLESMYLLGAALAQGTLVEQNFTEAAKWFHAASQKGHAKSRTSLAYLYATGRGVRRDPVTAFVFLSQASQCGDTQAGDLLFRLRKAMNPFQLKAAERRLREQATI